MPLFFFISGYLFKPKKEIVEAIKKKAFQLLLPYFIWCFISFLYWVIIERHFRGDSVSLSVLDGFKGIFLAEYPLIIYNAVLWFLPVLFLINIVFLFITNKIDEYPKVTCILLLCIVTVFSLLSCVLNLPELPWGINRVFKFIIYFYFGYFFHSYEKKFHEIKIPIAIVALIIQFLMLYLGLEKGWYDFIRGVCGSVATVYICELISNFISSKNIKDNPILKGILYFGSNTILVYILHGPLYRVCLGVLSKLFKKEITVYRESIVYVFLITLFVIGSILFVSKIINKFCPELLGRNRLRLKLNSSQMYDKQ